MQNQNTSAASTKLVNGDAEAMKKNAKVVCRQNCSKDFWDAFK
jgi:hypothetical protein